MNFIEQGIILFADIVWAYLLYLLIGGGLFLLLFSRFIPFRYFKHSLQIIRGKYEDPEQPGDITHFQALVSSLAAYFRGGDSNHSWGARSGILDVDQCLSWHSN